MINCAPGWCIDIEVNDRGSVNIPGPGGFVLSIPGRNYGVIIFLLKDKEGNLVASFTDENFFKEEINL